MRKGRPDHMIALYDYDGFMCGLSATNTKVTINNYSFEVIDSDPNHVHSVRIELTSKPADNSKRGSGDHIK